MCNDEQAESFRMKEEAMERGIGRVGLGVGSLGLSMGSYDSCLSSCKYLLDLGLGRLGDGGVLFFACFLATLIPE